MYKLIALDLDDTLLGRDGKIGAASMAAIAGARARGCEVTLVTARSWRATRPFVDELGLTMPVICMTGASVYSPDGRPLHQQTVPLTHARHLAALADAEDWSFRIYFPDGRIYHSRPADDFHSDAPSNSYPIGTYVGAISPFLAGAEEPLQVVALGNRSVEALLDAVAGIPDLVSTTYDRHSAISRTHVMHRDVQKGAALAAYCRERSIPREAVIAMGDGETDRSMIEWAGTGVAMGWAPDHVRQAADLVTAPDDPHPVATVINQLVLR